MPPRSSHRASALGFGFGFGNWIYTAVFSRARSIHRNGHLVMRTGNR